MSPTLRMRNRIPKILFLGLLAFLLSFLPFHPSHPVQVLAGHTDAESSPKETRGAARDLSGGRSLDRNLYCWNSTPFCQPAGGSFSSMMGYPMSQDGQRGMSDFASMGEAIVDDFLVNDDSTGGCYQVTPAIACDPCGNFIVTWTDGRHGNADVFAQRYVASGTPLGPEFKVNDDTGIASNRSPAIAMDGSGNFVIVWLDYRNEGLGIYAQRYDFTGIPLAGNFKVDDGAGISIKANPAVAMGASGNFVITWEWVVISNDVYAKIFDSTGTSLGDNFRVNDDSGGAGQGEAAVAVGDAGDFVITWRDLRTGSHCVYAQRYAWPGIPLGSNFQVNDDTGEVWKGAPAIDMNGSGDFVITWEDSPRHAIWAQRYDPAGAAVGSNFKVYNDAGSLACHWPDIAIDESGNFVVAWEDRRNGTIDIYAQRYDSTGTALGSNLKVDDDTITAYQRHPVIAIDCAGNFVICWDDYRQGRCLSKSWPRTYIYAQRYDFSGTALGPNFQVEDYVGSSYQRYPSIAGDKSGNFIITWEDSRESNLDVYAGRYDSSGIPLGPNFKVNEDNGCSWQQDPAVAADDSGNFVITWDGHHIYARRFNSAGTPLAPEFRVSDDLGGLWSGYDSPDIAMSGSGSFVITWRAEYHTEWWGFVRIYAQRYDASGARVGSNFWVNTNASGVASPAVAMAECGDFVITWHDYGHPDIYAQKYDSSGTALDSNFKVNDDAGSADQWYPAIAMDASGNFVITWRDWRDGNPDIYAQRCDSSGITLGPNFKVNDDSGTAAKMYPAIAMDGSGKFVIIWEDFRNGWSTPTVYAQGYDSHGNPAGPNNLVVYPRYASVYQRDPSVALNNSNIYFTWTDNRRAKDWDIYAKVVDWSWTDVEEDQEVSLPHLSELSQNYPNPFNPVTRIQYTVGGGQTPIHTTIRVYNILGQLVRTLVDEKKAPGHYNIIWDGKDSSGKEVASGIYFYQLKTKDLTDTKKMVLLR